MSEYHKVRISQHTKDSHTVTYSDPYILSIWKVVARGYGVQGQPDYMKLMS